MRIPNMRDAKFYQGGKKGDWREVEPPVLEAPVADTHAHIHLMRDPALELARAAAYNVAYIGMIIDLPEDGVRAFEMLDTWRAEAADVLAEIAPGCTNPIPDVRISVGAHPHNASKYDDAMERQLVELLADPRVNAVGEVGLDYHYDFSPRDVQCDVFRRQIRLAHEAGLPISLHLRGGDDPVVDNAHAQAFAILQEEGFPEAGTLLHCCTVGPDDLAPWVEAGAYVAYGGAVTFPGSEAIREGVLLVPEDRLLTETDTPYMAPVPMRGILCTPAHVIFTAAYLAELHGYSPGAERQAFLERLLTNADALLRRP